MPGKQSAEVRRQRAAVVEAFLTLSQQADGILPPLLMKRKWTEVGNLLSGKFDELAYAALVTWRYGLPELTTRLREVQAAGRDGVSMLLDSGCTVAQVRGVMFSTPNQHLRCLYYFMVLCDDRPDDRVQALIPDEGHFTKMKTRPLRESATPARLDAALISLLLAGQERLEEAISAAKAFPRCALLAETFGAYLSVTQAIRARDSAALRVGVSQCEKAFDKRARPDQFGFGGNMLGGETANEDVVDFRLACILKLHEGWPPATMVRTIHQLPR